jgi:anthranilate/para-aminobenzoate synthase component II
MILVVDNYDSFTYNLVQYLGELGERDIQVFRNDAITLEDIERMHPKCIIISPGPKDPTDCGITNAVIARFAPSIPILGVCLWPPVHCLC